MEYLWKTKEEEDEALNKIPNIQLREILRRCKPYYIKSSINVSKTPGILVNNPPPQESANIHSNSNATNVKFENIKVINKYLYSPLPRSLMSNLFFTNTFADLCFNYFKNICLLIVVLL